MTDAPELPVLLSVVMPAYNYGNYLRRAADSVLSQLRPDCELVVIDDGSTDDTAKVLEEIQASNPARFFWMRQDNAGAAAARNAGVRLSRGVYLLFLDADDELVPGALDAVCARIRESPRASVLLGGRLMHRADGREKYHPPPIALASDPCIRVADYLLHKRLGMSHGATVARRDLIEGRPYPEELRGGEDIPVFAHLFAHGEFAMIDKPLARIHKHADSLRHLRPDSGAHAMLLVNEVFRSLPAACAGMRGSYAARRYLSLFRTALRSGDRSLAQGYFRTAMREDCRQCLVPGQLRKNMKAVLAGLLRRRHA